MNKTKKYLAGSAVVIALSVCAYVLNQHQEAEKKEDNRVSYVDGKNNETKKNENLTPDQVSKKEGIEAEQIVVKITDQGYVTSHGDHFHFIPYSQMSALEEKVARNLPIGGQPVQSHPDNTKPSSPEKTSSTPSSTIKPNFNLNTQAPNRGTGGAYTTDDGYVFNPTDVIEDTGDAFVVPQEN